MSVLRAYAPRLVGVVGAVAAFALLAPSGSPPPGPGGAAAATLPSGFDESVAISGLTLPTVVRFASDGRVFVGEKSGLIKVFSSLTDTTPTTFADLRLNVHDFWDRGFLGMALHPNFPATPFVYVLYTYNHDPGSGVAPPRWPDSCPNPPGATSDGCVVSGRLSRLQAAGDVMTGSEQVLVEGWCQQYPSHSVGTVAFGPDGALYASAGDGASFGFIDWGQDGNPLNPCGDPPGGVGAALTPPTAEGGALRSQDLRTAADPVTLDGSIIRVDPTTGAALPNNPLAGNADVNARRIIAYGTRNPFRFSFRPGTSEIWLGDVGLGDWEEINRINAPADATVENFGWPCYEGNGRQAGYDAANLNICENLYTTGGAHAAPFYTYHHSAKVVPGETCAVGSSSISGIAFTPATSDYPSEYDNALFFTDYSRDCIWAMKAGGGSTPSPANIETFVADAANPVNLEFGPNGDLFYPDFDGGNIRRIRFTDPEPPGGSGFLSDLEWSSMTNGWGPAELDTSNGEDQGGDGNPIRLNGTTHAKGLGVHAVSDIRYFLGATCERFKASVGVDDEVGTSGSVTFEVWADAVKVYDSGLMTGSTATKLVDVSIAGAQELRLVTTDGGNDFSFDHADWALARVECGPDTTAPTVVGRTPPPGFTGAATDVSPTATFSEPMNPATLTTTTFTLVKQGTTTPVAATVSYSSNLTATLDPTAALEASTTYIATVKGGTAGAKDVAGNPLAADVTWSFTTGTSATVTTFLSDVTWTSMTNGWGPAEKDESNGENGASDGNPITLNGTVHAKGLGVHAASDIRYALDPSCQRFKASVGMDDEVGSAGTVIFQVFTGATKIYDSGVMNGATPTKLVDVSIAGATQLRLVVTDGGDDFVLDHADWALARIECGSGGGGGDTTPPTITGRTPAPGASGVAVGISPTATFSEAMNPATLTTTTFTLVRQGTTTPLAATVSYASQVATLDPTANLLASTAYVATVKGGASGAKDLAGNALAADVTWTFTTAGSNQPPAPVIDTPASTLTWKVGDNIAFTGHATDPEQGTLPASALSWRLLLQHCPSNCHTHVVQTWPGAAGGNFAAPDHEYPSYLDLELTATDSGGLSTTTTRRLDPQTVVLNFASSPSGLQLSVGGSNSTTPFSRTVIVGSANSVSAISPQDLSGTTYQFSTWSDGGAQTHNIVAPASPATFTATYTATGGTPSTYLSDLNWTSMTNGWGPAEKDRSNGENGAADGIPMRLNGTPYAKGLGVHAPSDIRYALGGNCSRFKASVGVDDEVGNAGSVLFEVYAGATEVYDSGVMTGATATKLVDVSIAGATELRLVVTDGGNGFVLDHADWALARVECAGGAGDTTPPTVTNRTPADGATAVALGASPTATFSEAMDAATLTTSTFTLVKQGQTTPVAANVSYAGQVATLDPTVNLDPSSTYVATVKGGTAGAKDVSGNALGADVTWSFTTGSAGGTTTFLSDLTWTSMTNGWGPAEKDESNGENGAGDGNTLTLNGTTYAKGLGVHSASEIRFSATGCTRFRALVGLDDEVGAEGSVVFQVFADATSIYDSGVMTGTTATKTIDVPFSGATELRLVVTDGGDDFVLDHADWALARIDCG